MLNERQRLQGFTQSHIVGENATETVALQKHQPVQPVLLIGAQGGIEVWWGRNRLQTGEIL